MSNPVIEHIANNIKTTVDGITTANGYNQDLTGIRPKKNDFSDVTPDNGVVLVWQEDDSPLDGAALSAVEFLQEFVLFCIVTPPKTSSDSLDTYLNQVKSDIRKALMVDHTRGGYALDTTIGASKKFDDGNGFTGIAVSCLVSYRTSLTDPYTQI